MGLWSTKDPEHSQVNSYKDYIFQYTRMNTFGTTVGFALGSLSTVCVIVINRRFFKRIPNSDWVHPQMIAKRKWIKGVVTSVGDGDGFRLYHTPGPFWRWPLKLRKVPNSAKDLKDETISIRLAGVDAPEGSHFGKIAQPYSSEALIWLKNEVEGKRLWVQLIRRDQYNRVVSIPVHPPRIPFLKPPTSRCISIAMLSAGYATTYEQSGAEYGRWGKEEFLKYEEDARNARRGMWASKVALESPAEYKKRHRLGEADVVDTKEPRTTKKPAPVSPPIKGWMRVIPFWR